MEQIIKSQKLTTPSSNKNKRKISKAPSSKEQSKTDTTNGSESMKILKNNDYFSNISRCLL